MTTVQAPIGGAPVPPRPAQWIRMTRLLLRDAMTYLVGATLVTGVFLVLGVVLARSFGWQLMTSSDLEEIGAMVRAEEGGVTIVASTFLLAGAAGVAAVVVPIVLATRTRVYVSAGATRRSVAVGQLLSVLTMAAYVLALTVVVLLVAGRGVDGMVSILGADAGEATRRLAGVTGLLLTGMAAGSAAVALSLRWPWWVGTTVLVLFLVILPLLGSLALPGTTAWLTEAQGWWGTGLLVAPVLATAYWWLVRRVPVR